MLVRMARVILMTALGAACAPPLAVFAGIVTFVRPASDWWAEEMFLLLAVIGALVGGTFGYLTQPDRVRRNQQDPSGFHKPPSSVGKPCD